MRGTVISDLVDFNPSRPIKRGSVASFVDMASLPVGERDISDIQQKEFVGGGRRFRNGDALLARITPCLENGKTAKVSGLQDGENAFGSTEFIVLSAKKTETDEDYVYYLARHPEFRSFAISRMEGTSGRQRVSWQAVSEFEFAFPEPHIRAHAGQFLRYLDDKIVLNRKLNETLEEMARALFQSWFVDFDPVKVKLAAVRHGRDPEKACMATISGKLRISPGKPKPDTLDDQLPTAEELDAAIATLDTLTEAQRNKLAQTATHFPANFQESELGLIPEGWEVSLSGEHLDVIRGFSYKGAGLADTGTPMHNLNSVYEGGGYKYEGIKHYTLPFKDKHKIKPGDVIITNTEQGFDHLLIGFGALVPDSFPEGIFSHHIYRVRPQGKSPLTNHFIYHLFLPGRFRSAVARFSNGTTVNMLPVDGLTKQLLCIPALELITAFTVQSRSLRKEQEKLHHQSRTLAELRDTLLPKLLSGELQIEPN